MVHSAYDSCELLRDCPTKTDVVESFGDEDDVSNYELEEESREYVNSVHIGVDNPVDKYSLLDEQLEEPHLETIVKDVPIEEPAAPIQSTVNQ